MCTVLKATAHKAKVLRLACNLFRVRKLKPCLPAVPQAFDTDKEGTKAHPSKRSRDMATGSLDVADGPTQNGQRPAIAARTMYV